MLIRDNVRTAMSRGLMNSKKLEATSHCAHRHYRLRSGLLLNARLWIVIERQFGLEEELLIVGHLNHQRDVKGILGGRDGVAGECE
jgi:hypothetical protein